MWATLLAVLICVVGAVLVYIRGIEQKLRMGQGIRLGLLCLIRTFPEIAGNSSVPGLWDIRRDQMDIDNSPAIWPSTGLLRLG
jgi:hypothetical protein